MEIRSFRYNARESTPKKKALKRFLSFTIAFLMLLSTGGYTYAAINKPLPSLSVTMRPAQTLAAETIAMPWPTAGQAAIGSLKDGLLARSNANETAKPIASTAKAVTALAVMKQRPFQAGSTGSTITLDETDVGFYNSYVAKGGSVAPVAAGEQLSQFQALEIMLLPSANNMADSLARWAFGSVDAYVTYANAMVREMGLTRTTIADASGFSASTVGTSADLLVIGQRVMSDPILKQIVSLKQASVPVAGIITNTNQLLPGKAIGIKTGHTGESGWCLIFAREISVVPDQKTILIGVVLGASSSGSLYASAEALLTAATTGFSAREVIKDDQIMGSYSSTWGQSGNIIADNTLSIYGWKGATLTPEATTSLNGSSVSSSQKAGTAKVGDAEINLVTDEAITPPSLWWKLTHYFGS